MLDERSVQTISTPSNIFKNKESMLTESLNKFTFDSTHFQQAFKIFLYAFNNVERPVKTSPTFGSTTVLKQILKPFKRPYDHLLAVKIIMVVTTGWSD